MTPPAKPARPYWHVDLKWVCGIALFFTLGAALLLYNLQTLTERERAINMSATIVASLFSRQGLDDATDFEKFRQEAMATPGDYVMPISQFPWLKISKTDLSTLTPRELRIAIFRQVTEPIYDKGLHGAAAQVTDDPVQQKEFAKDATLLGVFSKTTHDVLKRAFIVSALLAVLFMAGVIYFSAGWGRAVSPAILLLAVSPVGSLAALLLLHPPRDGDAPFKAIPSNVAEEIGGSLSRSYLSATVLGLVLLLGALVGKIVQHYLRKRGQKPATPRAKAASKT